MMQLLELQLRPDNQILNRSQCLLAMPSSCSMPTPDLHTTKASSLMTMMMFQMPTLYQLPTQLETLPVAMKNIYTRSCQRAAGPSHQQDSLHSRTTKDLESNWPMEWSSAIQIQVQVQSHSLLDGGQPAQFSMASHSHQTLWSPRLSARPGSTILSPAYSFLQSRDTLRLN